MLKKLLNVLLSFEYENKIMGNYRIFNSQNDGQCESLTRPAPKQHHPIKAEPAKMSKTYSLSCLRLGKNTRVSEFEEFGEYCFDSQSESKLS